MRCNVKSAEQRETEKIVHNLWESMLEAVLDAESVALVAVKRYFNLGPKRMNEFADFYQKTKSEFEQHARDEVFLEMMLREFDGCFDIQGFMTDRETFEHAAKKFDQRRMKPQVTEYEAKKIHEQMKAFRKVVSEE